MALRPPDTFVEQTRLIERNVSITRNVTIVDHRTLAMPLSKLAADPVAGKGLRHGASDTKPSAQQLHQQVAQLHQFREQRLQQEREGARARAAGGAAAARPRPMNLPHSPIAARPAPHAAGSHTDVARRSESERQSNRAGGSERAGSHTDATRRSESERQSNRAESERAAPARERVPPFRSEHPRVPVPDFPPRHSDAITTAIVRPHAQPLNRGRGASPVKPLIPACSGHSRIVVTQPPLQLKGRRHGASAAVSCRSLGRHEATDCYSTSLGCMHLRSASKVESNQALDLLSGPVRAWFEETFPHGPTPAQQHAWPAIAAGEHVLLVSPTGTGKTLAAFLAILDRLFRAWKPGALRQGCGAFTYRPCAA